MRRLLPFLLVACGSTRGEVYGPSYEFDAGVPAAHDAGAEVEAAAPAHDAGDWRADVVYLTLPDRFFNGDKTNDEKGEPNCFDPAHPIRFHGGDVEGMRQKLGYLADLGVTALWTTPLYRQTPRLGESCGYHGYWSDFVDPDDGEMEPKLGTFDEVARLRQELHARKMKLILDMVVNHPGRNARIVRQHADWFHDPATCNTLGSIEIFCPLSGLPDFAQEKAEVAAYLDALSKRWVERVKPDGIRMDTAKHVPMAYFKGSWFPAVRAAKKDVFVVAEVLDEGAHTVFLPMYDAGFDSVFDFPLRRALIDSFAKGGSVDNVARSVSASIQTFGIDRALTKVNLLDNHDVPRFLTEAGAAPDIEQRYLLAMTALFALPGIPQLYYGDELGAVGAFPENRRDMPAWAWGDATRAPAAGYAGDPRKTFTLVKDLARIRRELPVLYKGAFHEMWRQNQNNANLFAFYRYVGDEVAIVLLHNAAGTSTVSLPAAKLSGAFEDLLGRGAPKEIGVAEGRISVTLTGKVAGIYRVKK